MSALEPNCNNCGKKDTTQGHADKDKTITNQLENSEEVIEPNESLRESNESIHNIEEIKNIEEKQKHYTAKIKRNGIQEDFIINTGSPVTIMPFDDRIVDQTEIQKKNEPIPGRQRKRNEIPGEDTGEHRIGKQQTENGNFDFRKKGHDTTIGNGLDEKIQTNN